MTVQAPRPSRSSNSVYKPFFAPRPPTWLRLFRDAATKRVVYGSLAGSWMVPSAVFIMLFVSGCPLQLARHIVLSWRQFPPNPSNPFSRRGKGLMPGSDWDVMVFRPPSVQLSIHTGATRRDDHRRHCGRSARRKSDSLV